MEKKVKIHEVRNEKKFYNVFSYIFGGGTIGGYAQSREVEYYIDFNHNILKCSIDDTISSQNIEELNLNEQTFCQKGKIYHFEFIY